VKRALLVTAGTVAGLVSVLTYSAGEAPLAIASDVPGGGTAAGLGGPADDSGSNAAPGDPATPTGEASPAASPTAKAPASAKPSASAKPTASATAKATTATASAKPTPATTKSAAAKPSATPTKPAAPKPTPTPTKVDTGPKDYTGTAVTYKYGTLQMGIRVKGGKIIDAWAIKYPGGDSQPYSEMAMPILRSQTIKASSANIGGATGASLTSAAWKKSLQGAIAKAGL
jgi:uncharacterized protein with FMN-binding domain